MDAADSLMAAGQPLFTTKMVYELMTGQGDDKAGKWYSEQALQRVQKVIDKLRFTPCRIDWSRHAEAKKLPKGTGMMVETVMLPADKVKLTHYGQEGVGYYMQKNSQVYRHAHAVGQICTVEKKVLDVPGINNSEDNIVLKHYLIRRIEGMRDKKNRLQSDIVLLSSIYEICSACQQMDMKRTRKRVMQILDYWKEIGYIADYELVMEGRTTRAIRFSIPEDAKALPAKEAQAPRAGIGQEELDEEEREP